MSRFGACFLLLLLVVGPALAGDGAVTGSVEGFVEARAQVSTGVDGFPATFVERFRPDFQAHLGKHFVMASTVELLFVEGRRTSSELERIVAASDLGPLVEAQGGFPQPANKALGISKVSDYLNVERLFVDVYTKPMDLRVGRQAINWGPAFLVNPTDPFPEVLLTEPWRQRRGVNAARFTFPIGDLNLIQAVVGTDDLFQNVRAALRGSVNVRGVDVSLMGAYRQEADNGVVGLSVRGTAGVGYWVEASLHVGKDQEPYEEIAVGVDYSVPVLDRLVLTGQYYRNGHGDPDPHAPAALATLATGLASGETPSAAADFAPYFSGRDYAMLSVSLGIVREVSLSAFWLQNCGDGTGLIVPTLGTYPTPWLEISLSAQAGFRLWGEGGEFSPRAQDLVVTVPIADGVPPATLDLSGLSPTSTLTLWARANF